ncbi:hypothetical protein FB45DRAFT_757151, partial [Roridomyces roridus]
PTFADIREHERNLAQQSILPVPTRARPRYLHLPDEAWGSGMNNVFQAQLLNTHLAYLSHRGYVFKDYVASAHPPFPDTFPNGTQIHLRIPMNAITSGPTGGGSLGVNVDETRTPRAISLEWWDTVCPPSEVVELGLGETNDELGMSGETTGLEKLNRWVEKLRRIEAPCVKITGGEPFDWMFIASTKILDLWPSYGNSPTLKEFAWSALVTRALSRNFALFSPSTPPPSLLPTLSHIGRISTLGTSSSPYPLSAFTPYHTASPPIPGLLALHVRRGDYSQHCRNLVEWGSDYSAWNGFGNPSVRAAHPTFPALPDYLSVPEGMTHGEAAYAHCWPSLDEIVSRAREVRLNASQQRQIELSAVYVATNGEPGWVGELMELLRKDGWERVATSLDMQLARDEVAVAQAVDMSVMVAAEVFIGVGFSSLSSNVVQLRLAGGRHAATNRFW